MKVLMSMVLSVLIGGIAFAQNTPTVTDTVNSDGSVTRVVTMTRTFTATQYQAMATNIQNQSTELQSKIATLQANVALSQANASKNVTLSNVSTTTMTAGGV